MPVGSHLNLYRRLAFGDLIDFNVLDTRQYRSNQACGDGARTDCAEAVDPARTILGTDQEKWLFDNLATVRSRWTVLGQQVPIFARDFSAFDPGRPVLDGQVGRLRRRPQPALASLKTRAPNPVALSATCTCITAPI